MITKKAAGMPYVMSSFHPYSSYAPAKKGVSRQRQALVAKKEKGFNGAGKQTKAQTVLNEPPSKSAPSTPDKHSDNSVKIVSPET